MTRPHMTRDEWLQSLRERIEPVGQCLEWSGHMMGKTPRVYCPRGYLYPGSLQASHTVRTALWCLKHECRPPAQQILRTSCRNARCVHEGHWLVLDRSGQSREQSRRNELQTVKALTAKMRSARGRAKLTPADVAAIKASSLPSRAECRVYGVSMATVNAIRAGRLWRSTAPGSSVFSQQPPRVRAEASS